MIKRLIPYVSGSSYNMKVLLEAASKDYGFYDTYTGATAGSLSEYTFNYTVTGTSSNRLEELRKYSTSPLYSDRYFTGGSPTVDGLDLTYPGTSTGGTIVLQYYIGGIKYLNVTPNGSTATTTTFTMNSTGLSPLNFENKPILKLEEKQNMAENPFINSDVFIIRQEIPVFEKSIRLRGVSNLSEVVNYAGGNYFKIFNNT